MKKTLAIAALFFTALTGSAIAGDHADVQIEAKSAKVSAKSVATLKVSPKGQFHMNKEFPTKLTLSASDGVTLEKTKQTKADAVKFEDGGAVFEVAFTATSPGKKTFTGELKTAVCKDTECKPIVEKVAFEVEVK